ncbi:MAG TPA: cupin-like domain-containing protein [Myxococcales bacterium]|nr:cupin-like domain-containing protein [Myxococcales bacterium]
MLGRHNLHESGLFSDESLVDLLDRHPRELVYAITMGDDPARNENRLALHDRVSGRDLLEAVKRGRFWLNVTRVNTVDSRFRDLIERLYRGLANAAPGFKPQRVQGSLVISSPHAIVYLHADAPPNILWHVRGRKRIWIYPALDERFLPRKDLEDILASARHEYLPYRAEFDEHATFYEVGPGDMVTWPQNAPHRVTNLDSFNVALSTEHFTARSRARVRLYCANRFLRNRFGLSRLSNRVSGPGALAKVVVHRAARAMGLEPDPTVAKQWVPTLRVSAESPTGVVALS